jgi:hypothetical protein
MLAPHPPRNLAGRHPDRHCETLGATRVDLVHLISLYFDGVDILGVKRLFWLVLLCELTGEGFLSSVSIMFMASCATSKLSVSDDQGWVASIVVLFEGNVGDFAGTRHDALISSIAASVT